ncbi:hypothetical protein BIW11_07271 [Tropilaelaps mercedesae]|uniref:FP protein C-terminal domain-containing protein n=1 Tax=Tropilaelaps mercedesae TaxID=418985 RepID=A0A1V9XUP4_9ACAR|nr:hypothetical protein BIW11_07271 [Tropilaelaps mercedesae]
MSTQIEPASCRFYISLPVDDAKSLDALAEVAERLKLSLWPDSANEERRKYSDFNRSKVHITLWACDLLVGEEPLKERLKIFMRNNRRRFSNLKIRFEKLSYLAKTKTRYIVVCLDPSCRKKIEALKHCLEKSFRDLGKSLLDRDTCQLHCSIVACTSLNVRVNLLDVLRDFRPTIADVNEIHPTRLIVTSKWKVLACGTFQNGSVNDSQLIQRTSGISSDGRESPVMDDAFEEDDDVTSRTIELINFPVTPNEQPRQLLLTVSSLVGYPLKEWMICSCERDSSQINTDQRAPDIVAVLADQEIRNEFLANVKEYWKNHEYTVYATAVDSHLPNNKISVVRQLPVEKKLLLGKAKRFRIEHGFKYCWMEDNEICLRKDDTGPVYPIRTIKQLQNMVEERLEGQPCCYIRRQQVF